MHSTRPAWPAFGAARTSQEPAQQSLAAYRGKIDAVDQRIVELLNTWARIVQNVGRLKKQQHLPVSAPGREKEVYRHVMQANAGPLPGESIQRIYQVIVAEMVRLETPLAGEVQR